MGIIKTKLGAKLLMIYSSLVAISLIIGFVGAQNPFFLFAAVFLTLPWSLSLMPSYGFSLAHGALGDEVALYFVAFAAMNAFIIYLLGKMIERLRT